MTISANTQAILLLTAPLQIGRSSQHSPVLTPGEYKRLAQQLYNEGSQPSDLLGHDASLLITKLQAMIEPKRLEELLGRGFLLSQAIEHWQARAIWVVSRADADYPRRIKSLLKENSPAIFYGCGNRDLLNAGGLAVVGSRHVDDLLIHYTEEVGRLAARSFTAVVSGGARGVDQAAMRGALANGGKAIGVLADSLERAVVNRENRAFLLENQLVLISPYDPSAGFHVGNAMQRNKLIYALADAALVVSSDLGKGGTWTGAVEQLEKYHFVPLFVRTGNDTSPGLAGLQRKGALSWPELRSPDELQELIVQRHRKSTEDKSHAHVESRAHDGRASDFANLEVVKKEDPTDSLQGGHHSKSVEEQYSAMLMEKLATLNTPKSAGEIAADLQIPPKTAKKILERLVKGKKLQKIGSPAKYLHYK